MSAFAVLGLLSQAPASGYQLTHQVEGAISNFWPMSKSNVYGELTRLEDLGLVEGAEVNQVKLPNKRVFQLTAAGGETLDAWLREPTFRKERRKNSLLVKMLFADRLSPEQVADLIRAARTEAEAERARLAAIVELLDKFPAAYWGRCTALFGLRHAEASVQWADEMCRELNEAPRSAASTVGRPGRPPGQAPVKAPSRRT